MRQSALRNAFAQMAHSCLVAEKIVEAHDLRLSTQRDRSKPALISPQLRHHANGIFRTQRNLRLHANFLAGNKPQPPALCKSCEGENRFHPRERLADALTAAASEREVGEARTPGLALRCETFRIEAQRIGE